MARIRNLHLLTHSIGGFPKSSGTNADVSGADAVGKTVLALHVAVALFTQASDPAGRAILGWHVIFVAHAASRLAASGIWHRRVAIQVRGARVSNQSPNATLIINRLMKSIRTHAGSVGTHAAIDRRRTVDVSTAIIAQCPRSARRVRVVGYEARDALTLPVDADAVCDGIAAISRYGTRPISYSPLPARVRRPTRLEAGPTAARAIRAFATRDSRRTVCIQRTVAANRPD